MFNNVDLPLPDAPKTAVRQPASTRKSTPSATILSANRLSSRRISNILPLPLSKTRII